MKRNSVLLIVVIFLMISGIRAQDCAGYYPVKVGAQWVVTSYNEKNAVEGTSKMKLTAKTPTATGYDLNVAVQSLDNKGKNQMDNTLKFQCKNGIFYWDMNQFLQNAMPAKGMEGMTMKVTGTQLAFPAKLSVGQTLENAEMTVSMESGGMSMMSFTWKIFDRKVEATESVTTPAGTFECYRISYKMESNSGMKMEMTGIDWIGKGVGVVKSQQFDKGKMKGYSLLTSYTE
ncbi:MAG: hypothetical protein NTU44_18725 [Bacteroidetes bacterium]|nr:hypothetical protein [Bacteroidota bacterium]